MIQRGRFCHWLAVLKCVTKAATCLDYSHCEYWNVSASKSIFRLTPGTNQCVTDGSRIRPVGFLHIYSEFPLVALSGERTILGTSLICMQVSFTTCLRASVILWEKASWQRDQQWRGGRGGTLDARRRPCRGKVFGQESQPHTCHRAAV